jgi:hypothetical protein
MHNFSGGNDHGQEAVRDGFAWRRTAQAKRNNDLAQRVAAAQRPQVAWVDGCRRRRRRAAVLRGRLAQADTAGGTLVWGMPAETDILDPHATGGQLTYDVTYQMLRASRRRLTDPNVAYRSWSPRHTEWEISDDGVQYTFAARRRRSMTARRSMRRRSSISTASGTRGRRPSEGEGFRRRLQNGSRTSRSWADGHQGHVDPANYEWIRSGLQTTASR